MEAINGLIFGLIGVVVGWALTQWSEERRSKKTEKQQRSAVRTLLSLEIDKNLALVRDFWEGINENELDKSKSLSSQVGTGSNRAMPARANRTKSPSSSLNLKLNTSRLARKLVEAPLPRLSQRAFDSQLSLLPLALRKDEIEQIYDFYNSLERIANIQATLLHLSSKQEMERSSHALEANAGIPSPGTDDEPIGAVLSRGRSFSGGSFDQNAPELWKEFEQVVNRMFDKGNPLRSRV